MPGNQYTLVSVVSVTQQIDFIGTVGKMIASVLFAVAEMEQEKRTSS